MSKVTNRTLRCRKCQKEFDVQIYESVNVSLNPELREKFIFDELYVFKCPHCGEIHHIPYPILYHDMDKGFMVQTGSLEDVYNFFNMDVTMNGLLDGDNNPLNRIIRTGATRPTLAKEKVVALENGLNHKLATIYSLVVRYQYDEYAKENNLPESENAYLCYDDGGDMAVIVEYVDENNELNCICQKFNKGLYEQIENELAKYVEGTCDYLFDSYSAHMVLNTNERRVKVMRILKPELALVRDINGNSFFVKIPTFNYGKFTEGDTVIIETKKHWTHKCKVLKVINDQTLYSLPVDVGDLDSVLWKINEEPLSITGASDDELDNEDLLKGLVDFDKPEGTMPYELMRDSDVVLGFCVSLNGPIFKQNEDGSEEEIDIENASVGDIFKPIAMRQRLVKYMKDEHPLLAIYLDQKNVPDDDNGEGVSKMIVNFDDAIRYVIQMSELFDGICINPNEECITIPTSYLVGTYLPDRILTNDKRTIRVLDKLTDKEKKYISEESLDYIGQVYFDGKTPKQIAEENHIDPAKVGNALSKGYAHLKDVVRANYK